jgi:gamma-glutamyltranspeptidase/glutathione hydrolase
MSWIAEPALTSPCGGGFMLVRTADGRTRLLDAFTAIPGVELERDGRRVRDVDTITVNFNATTTQIFHIGAGSTAVPGVLAGMEAAHRRFGRLLWRDLLRPAAAAARAGVRLSPRQCWVSQALAPVFLHTPESRAIFAPEGHVVCDGDSLAQPELAATIDRLAEAGAADLYTGELARAVVDHQRETGGRVTAADLAAYRPAWRRPLDVPLRIGRFLSNPPPSSGGILIAYTLAVLDEVVHDMRPDDARWLRALAEAMRATTRMRGGRFAGLLHRGGLAAHVLSDEAVRRGREAVRDALAGRPGVALPVAADAGTTHVSVLDGDGMAVAFTASNGCHSGVIVPGTGLHLNNMMGEEDLAAGRDRAPGGRLTSMQAPSLVLDAGGDVRLVVGSSGSNRLRSAIVQVVCNTLDFGMGVAEAVGAPRVHVEGDRLDCEGGMPARLLDELEGWGERLVRFDDINLYFGGANVVTSDGGRLDAAGDPRRDGFGIVLE